MKAISVDTIRAVLTHLGLDPSDTEADVNRRLGATAISRASFSGRSPRSNYGSVPGNTNKAALAPVPEGEGGADDDFDRQ